MVNAEILIPLDTEFVEFGEFDSVRVVLVVVFEHLKDFGLLELESKCPQSNLEKLKYWDPKSHNHLP